MDARNTLLSLVFLASLSLGGCATSPAAKAPETPSAHPMLGFAVAGHAPRTAPGASEDAPTERYEEPGRIYDAMHGYSRGSPR
jgi:hypothetical protein